MFPLPRRRAVCPGSVWWLTCGDWRFNWEPTLITFQVWQAGFFLEYLGWLFLLLFFKSRDFLLQVLFDSKWIQEFLWPVEGPALVGGVLWRSVALEWNCCPHAALCEGRGWNGASGGGWASSQAWYAPAVRRPLARIDSGVPGEELSEWRRIFLIPVDLTRPVCILHFRRKTVLTSSLKQA